MTNLLLFYPGLVLVLTITLAIVTIIAACTTRGALVLEAIFVLAPISPILALRIFAVGIVAFCDWLVADRDCTREMACVARRLQDEFAL